MGWPKISREISGSLSATRAPCDCHVKASRRSAAPTDSSPSGTSSRTATAISVFEALSSGTWHDHRIRGRATAIVERVGPIPVLAAARLFRRPAIRSLHSGDACPVGLGMGTEGVTLQTRQWRVVGRFARRDSCTIRRADHFSRIKAMPPLAVFLSEGRLKCRSSGSLKTPGATSGSPRSSRP